MVSLIAGLKIEDIVKQRGLKSQGQLYIHILVTPPPPPPHSKFHSISLYSQTYSSYRQFWEKCTEWPQNDLQDHEKSSPIVLKHNVFRNWENLTTSKDTVSYSYNLQQCKHAWLKKPTLKLLQLTQDASPSAILSISSQYRDEFGSLR